MSLLVSIQLAGIPYTLVPCFVEHDTVHIWTQGHVAAVILLD
jgi:hypothetical protein